MKAEREKKNMGKRSHRDRVRARFRVAGDAEALSKVGSLRWRPDTRSGLTYARAARMCSGSTYFFTIATLFEGPDVLDVVLVVVLDVVFAIVL